METTDGPVASKGPAARWPGRDLAIGACLILVAFVTLAFFDRAIGGILFLAGLCLLIEARGQFHPLFALLFPLLALTAAVSDAARGMLDAALRWFLGAFVIFALGRVLRRRRVALAARPNPVLETLTAELAGLKAKRDRGEITEEEFRARRDATLSAFREATLEPPASPSPHANP